MPGHIPEETIDQIRQRADIVDVIGEHAALKKKGRDFWGRCPFHDEKTPSFKVSPEYQSFYCFGCQKSGNVFTFLMEYENLDFPAAARVLAERTGVVIPEQTPGDREAATQRRSRQEQLLEVLDSAARWYANILKSSDGTVARQYLESRGLPQQAVEDFGLGYALDAWDAVKQWGQRRNYTDDMLQAAGLLQHNEEKNRSYDRFRARLMFPIHDHLGRVVGFSGRILQSDDQSAKYVNTSETELFQKSRLLYGLHRARRSFREHGYALVCEGQLDVIACHRAGLTNAVAPQGTAFTDEQAHMLKRFAKHVAFAFDADKAGQKAAVRSVQVALQIGLETSAIQIPEGQDPDSILSEQGADALKDLAERRIDGFEFLLLTARAAHPGGTPADTTAIVDDLLPPLCSLDNPVRLSAQTAWLAEQLQVPEAAVSQAVEQRRRAEEKRSQRRTPQQAGTPPKRASTVPYNRRKTPVARAGAEAVLLDLALRHGPIAHALAEDLPAEDLSDTPVGRALNIVLAHTQQGEWSDAALHLSSAQDLAEDTDVGRVLADSAFQPPAPDAAERDREKFHELIERAKADALRALQRARLRERMQEIQQAATAAETPESRLELLQEYQSLARQCATPPQV